MTTSFDLSEDTAMLSLRELVRLFGATEEAKLDPIFPAMKRHYELWLRYVELDYTDPRDEEARSRANEAESVALEHLLSIAPTTLRGLRTIIAYLVEFDRDSLPETSGEYMATLLRSPVLCG